ncbi:hypothetical protein ASPWEDRAFT_174422 [Aspergillus wentii DTO 134E9]|uniref:Chromo domain-containing protein n=1 Tax=Aspergillus wentii DTO 134E9 TaxID=1073089 RepID=A0A1L9RDL1_ASPWE|nr:uncharacterized protein ASPWEDRAFT_174422 [Aspergillus wentii DTO 134E9]OJJ32994.1 hypothetical protein ASPWEDRAFT_174422 [Aspergillus wentii DTO 134E9]
MMRRKRNISSSVSIHQPADESRRKILKQHYVIESSEEDETENEDDDGEESSEIGEDEYLINCILDESENQYFIDWQGPWSPTWEPKENANDLAVQVWEEKKKNREKEVQESSEPIEPLSPIPSPPGSHTTTPNLDQAECETEPRHSDRRSPSPLFVPFEAVSESPIDEEGNETLISGFGEVVSSLPHSGTSSYPGIASPAAQQSKITIAFEHVPATPIPSEFKLPDESENRQLTDSSRTAPPVPAASYFHKPGSPPIYPETPNGNQTSRPIEKEISQIQQFPRKEVKDRSGVVDEIAETPSGPPSAPVSQSTSLMPGLQQLNSGFSSLISHLNSPGCSSESFSIHTSITVRHTGQIRESVVAGSQSSSNLDPGISNHRSPPITPKYSASQVTISTMDEKPLKKEGQSSADTKYSHVEGSTPREKLRNAWAQLRANSATRTLQNVDASATPSSAGDIEPSTAPAAIPESAEPLSVRVDKEPAHSMAQIHPATTQPESLEPLKEIDHSQHPSVHTIQPSELTVSQLEEAPPGSVQLGPSEFAIPLPMDSRVKDDYDRVLKEESRYIQEFINNTSPDSEFTQQEFLVTKMHRTLEQLSNVTTHPDLNVAEHIKDSGSDLEKEAAWAEYSSAKFLFLGYLIQIAHSHDLHLVVMVHGEKTQKVVEHYLLGKGLTYTQPRHEMGSGINANLEVSMAKGSLSFGIQSTHSDGVFRTYKSPSAVIALDASFNAKSPSVEHMRTTFARNGHLLPVIRLLVSNTSEHVECCFPNLPTLQRLRLLVQYTVRLREMVGDLQDDALGVHEDAEEVLSCLISDNFHSHWPLPLIEPLQVVAPDELETTSFLQNQLDLNSEQTPLSNTAAQKRAFVDDTDEQFSKRQRMDTSQLASQFTESSKFPSQTLDSGLQMLERNIVQMRSSHAAEIDKLQKALNYALSRLQEKEKALESLQHRYESRTKETHKIRQERDDFSQSKLASEQRVERQKEEITKLKDDRTQLRHDLESARESLKNGGGTAAELESAQEEIRRLTKENSGLRQKAEYEKNQGEYTREQYQTASNVASQSGNEIRQLRAENEALNRKVAGDSCRLKELNMQSDGARHLSRVAELEATLASRDDLLRKKEDELREIRKNRPSTRSTSTQPRSPKLTSASSRPTSPGINNGNGLNHSGRGSGLRFMSGMSL